MTAPRNALIPVLLAAAVLVLAGFAAHAAPARKLVAAGNEAFAAGDFEKALALYDEASVETPESAQIYFNRGTALYKRENYEEAREALKDAAVRSKEPDLAARAKFNLGNCAFRQAERQRDSDLKKAIEHCQEAIASYQEAHDLDPGLKQASENIEIVRLFMKILFDEQKKKEEQQKENQEQEENIVQKLQKLIERQNGLIKENGELAGQKPDGRDPARDEEWKKSVGEIGTKQGVLRDDTRAVLEEIEQTKSQIEQQAATAAQGPDPNQPQPQPPAQPQGQGQPSPEEMRAMAEKFGAAAGHVTNAISSEQAAMSQLAAAAQETAAKNQDAAVRSLEEAVKALADPNQQQQQQSGDQQQQEEGKEDQQQQDQQQGEEEEPKEDDQRQPQDGEEKKEGEQQDQPQESKDDQESEEERQARARMERAEDILDEEKKQRRPVQPRRNIPVDRDW